MHQRLCTCKKLQALAARPLSYVARMAGMGRDALAAAVAIPR